MRLELPPFLKVSAPPALVKALLHVGRFETRYGRFILPVLGWLVAGIAPLVPFDAGGGQTAIEIVRYVVFRGLDRDGWYAAGPVFMLGGALAASTVLLGLVLHSVGLVFKDKTLTYWGCGTILVSLLVVILATQPIAAFSLFGIVALPHVGWWLVLFYAPFTFWSTNRWLSTPTDTRR